MIRRFVAAVMITTGLLAGGAGTAFADPDFGPGNSDKRPHDPGAICHPPGQTSDFPACK
jgi:hypothetical protein